MILSRLFVSAGAFLLGAPLLILFGTGMCGAPGIFLPLLAVAITLAVLVRMCKKGRALLCASAVILLFVCGLVLSRALGMTFTAIFPCALCAGMIPLHLLFLCQAPGEEYPPTIWYVGLPVHILSLFLLRSEYLAQAAAAMHVVSPLYFVFFLFALNEYGVSRGMAGDRHPSPQMRLHNRIRTGAVAALLMIATHTEAIKNGLTAVLHFIRDVICRIIQWLMRGQPESARPAGEGGGMDLSGLAENAQTPAFWRILEAVFRVLALVIAVILLFFILKKLFSVCVRALRLLVQMLRRYAAQVNNAYEDTVETLLDWGEMRRGLFLRRPAARRKEPPVDWNSLSPRENVRMRYRQLRLRRKETPDHLTARHVILSEKSAAQAADIYDKARYSSQDISPAEAERMKSLLQ